MFSLSGLTYEVVTATVLDASCRHLLVDRGSRKVIVVEHPLIPLVVKDALVRVLFLNIQVCCVSFFAYCCIGTTPARFFQ